jgi:sterol desaturase/sphingolipid hydroxylase (fatty acid hydroxylase superfamily)
LLTKKLVENPFFNGFLEFGLLFLVIYTTSLIILFVTGVVVSKLNTIHPERKIQKRKPSILEIDDIKSSVTQLIVTSLCLTLGLYAQLSGWVLFEPFELNWWSFPLFFLMSVILHDTWFYWGHRILHTKIFYRFHSPHHRSVTPTVWSNDAGHAVDTLIAHSYYTVVVFVLPIPPVALLAHRLFDQISALVGHCGFEHFASKSARKPWPLLCTVFHDQHHQYFLYNYGNYFSVWGRLLGTIHPSYDSRVEEFENLYAGKNEG